MKTSRIWASRSDLALSLSSASLLFFAHLLLSLFTCLFIILFFDLPHSNFFLSDFPLRIYPLFSPAHASLFSLPFPRIPSPFLTHIFVFSPSLPPMGGEGEWRRGVGLPLKKSYGSAAHHFCENLPI